MSSHAEARCGGGAAEAGEAITRSQEESRGPLEGRPDVETTVDGFHGGRFHLVQPKGQGFRAGLDALLLAASVPASRGGDALDLGAGSGAVALAIAARCPAMRIALVEKHPFMADLARRSLALPENRDLAPRLRVVAADALARRPEREAAGLLDGAHATVVTNPPFHPPGGRGSPDAMRDAALTLPGADVLAAWIRTAAALLEPKGLFAMIARPDSLEDILGAARNRLGDMRILPVHSRPGRPAIRILVHARKGSRAGLKLLPPIVLYEPDGSLGAAGRAVGTGEATIDLGLG